MYTLLLSAVSMTEGACLPVCAPVLLARPWSSPLHRSPNFAVMTLLSIAMACWAHLHYLDEGDHAASGATTR